VLFPRAAAVVVGFHPRHCGTLLAAALVLAVLALSPGAVVIAFWS